MEIRRVRTSGEIIGAVFDLLRVEFFPLLKLLVLTAGPFVIVAAVLLSTYQAGLLGLMIDSYGDWLNLHLIAAVFCWLMGFLSVLVTTNLFLVRYEENNGILPATGEFVAEVWRHYLPVAVLGLLLTFAVCLGFLFLIIPGIYLSIAYTLAFVVYAKEGGSLPGAMARSMQLIRGAWWRTFVLLFIASLVQGFLGFIFDLPLMAVNIFVEAPFSAEDISFTSRVFKVLAAILSHASVFFYAISYLAIGMHYYSLREEKEARELFTRIDAIR